MRTIVEIEMDISAIVKETLRHIEPPVLPRSEAKRQAFLFLKNCRPDLLAQLQRLDSELSTARAVRSFDAVI